MKKYLSMLAAYGMLVDFNTPDLPGGEHGGSGGSGGSGDDGGDGGSGDFDNSGNDLPGGKAEGGEDDGEGDGDDDADDKDGDADDKGGDDTDDKGGDDKGNAPNFEEKFDALSSQIAGLVEILQKSNSGDDGGNEKSGLLSLEHDDLVALMADDPKDFISKLTQEIHGAVSQQVASETANSQFNKAVESTINQYADANPDFEKMWDEGKLQSFIDKNPGHNAISAHMAMTMESRIEAARKEGAKEAIKNYKKKAESQVLGDGPGIPPGQRDAALKNPSKFGGRAAVVAARAGIK